MGKIGYIRVSTTDQNIDRQEIALKEKGVEKLFIEKASGKDAKRPELKAMMGYVREGDMLYIESISRLARSTSDLLHIVGELQKKGVQLVSLKESIDTTTAQGRFILTIFAAMAEMDLENIKQRQREGIDAAKAKGKHLGRPPVQKPKDWDSVVCQWKAGKITAVEAFAKLGMPKATFYKLVKGEAFDSGSDRE